MESQWLREAIQLSLRAHAQDEKRPPEQGDPRFRKLAEGVLFSRKFVPTYHLVIVGFICLLSAIHWTGKALRWRRRRASRLPLLGAKDAYETIRPTSQRPARQTFEGISSSSCSTIEGAESPPRKVVSEETRLLHNDQRFQPSWHVYSATKAFLMYQPGPIPIVDKTLPSNGTSIAILIFIGLNIFYIFFRININIFEIFVLADRFGLVFITNLPLLYLLAAKTQPLKLLTGWSYESLNIFHRRLGELLCLAAFFHGGGMLIVWYTILRPDGIGLGEFLSFKLVCLELALSSRMNYFILLLCLASVIAGIFLLDRVVYRIGIKSMTIGACTKILEDEDTVRLSSVIFLQPESRWTMWFGGSIIFGWKATDHVFVTVPSLSSKRIIQGHPFTLASPAPLAGDEEARLELLVRAQDGFSRDVLNAARLHKYLSIRLDGPYGSSHARTMLEDSDLAIVVAGGSGVAVGFPLIHHLLDISRSTDTEIVSTFVLLRQKIILIWVIREEAHLSWVGRPALGDAENRGAEIIVPQATEEIGRPDLQGMICEIVEKFASGFGKKTRVVASGPDSLARAVRKTCAGLVREGRDVDVAIEKLG